MLPSDYLLLRKFFTMATPVNDDLFDQFSILFEKKEFSKGEFILKEGEVETKSNIVVKGVVHQYVYDEDAIITTNITPKGLAFNSLKSYIDESPSFEIHEAITDVELLYIEKKDIENLASENKEFCYLLYKIYANILLDRENRMFMLQYRSPAKRFIIFHELIERSQWILDGTPDKFIASYLNMTPQQYSKEKRKVQKNLKMS